MPVFAPLILNRRSCDVRNRPAQAESRTRRQRFHRGRSKCRGRRHAYQQHANLARHDGGIRLQRFNRTVLVRSGELVTQREAVGSRIGSLYRSLRISCDSRTVQRNPVQVGNRRPSGIRSQLVPAGLQVGAHDIHLQHRRIALHERGRGIVDACAKGRLRQRDLEGHAICVADVRRLDEDLAQSSHLVKHTIRLFNAGDCKRRASIVGRPQTTGTQRADVQRANRRVRRTNLLEPLEGRGGGFRQIASHRGRQRQRPGLHCAGGDGNADRCEDMDLSRFRDRRTRVVRGFQVVITSVRTRHRRDSVRTLNGPRNWRPVLRQGATEVPLIAWRKHPLIIGVARRFSANRLDDHFRAQRRRFAGQTILRYRLLHDLRLPNDHDSVSAGDKLLSS